MLTFPVPMFAKETVPDEELPTSVPPKLRLELLALSKYVCAGGLLVAVPDTLTDSTLLLREFVLKTMVPL
jgi:hypothetical protein